jgi:hypothetical protein
MTPVCDLPWVYTQHFLRMESGWEEVAKGLSRVLLGYFVLMAGPLVGLGLVCLALLNTTPGTHPLNPLYTWVVTVGVGLLSLIGAWGYALVVRGQWKCLINVPERHGARWLMFASMTCLLFSPALTLACSISGIQHYPEFDRGPMGIKYLEYTPLGGAIQIASGAISLASYALFMGFLRAVACCFEDKARIAHVNFYLWFLACLVVGSVIVITSIADWHHQFELVFMLATGWLASFFWYVFLVASVRSCITTGMSELRSPLEV